MATQLACGIDCEAAIADFWNPALYNWNLLDQEVFRDSPGFIPPPSTHPPPR